MGLDITVVPFVEITEQHRFEGSCWEKGHIVADCSKGMERSLRGLESKRCYVAKEQSWSFRAGSYSGYNCWREELAKAAELDLEDVWVNPEIHTDDPFYELLDFADNEGTIGPEACADLAKDFEDLAVKYRMPQECQELFDTWAMAFQDAANNGMIVFH